ncbi:MAG: hypothetical protein ACRCU2_28560, partial [Planktothrix sp.]
CKQQGKPGTSINSVGYTPYEQQQGRAEPRSDFFALGRTFVFLLTGKTPREFEDSITKGLQWQNSASGYAKPLRDFLDELMQPDVTKRPTNTTVILSAIQKLEKQLQPQYYSSPILAIPGWMSPQRVMVKTWEITEKIISNTAILVGDSGGYVLGAMTRAVRSVFSLGSEVMTGLVELISNILIWIFGGIGYLFEAVWSGLQTFGEALGNFCRSFPWKSFALSLICFAFMGYLISPWNQELIIWGLLGVFWVLVEYGLMENNNDNIPEFFEFFPGVYWITNWILVFIVTWENLKYIDLDLTINLPSGIILWVMFMFYVIVTPFFLIIFFGNMKFKNSIKHYEFKNGFLKSITLSLGLGIGWMIYQHFPILESPPPLLEILKDLHELSPD